jgi:hypothetical protein
MPDTKMSQYPHEYDMTNTVKGPWIMHSSIAWQNASNEGKKSSLPKWS